jgi:hypothetical protein
MTGKVGLRICCESIPSLPPAGSKRQSSKL